MKDNKILLNVLRYAISFIIGGLIALSVFLYISKNSGSFDSMTLKEKYSMLCDVFLIPGIVFTGLGFVVIISDEGFFDIFSYSVKSLIYVFIRHKDDAIRQTYYEYKEEKKQKRDGRSRWYLVIVGLVYFIPCIIFLILYMNMK